MGDHTKLRAFELADEAAVSVSSNSVEVEGCARDCQSDYLRFLSIAFGSLRELHYQVSLLKR